MDTRRETLQDLLGRPSIFEGGLRRVPWPVERIGLRDAVAAQVSARGFCDTPLPLDDLHRRMARAHQLPGRGPLSAPSTSLREGVPELEPAYHALVRYLAHEVLGHDVLFEQSPLLRYHFPVPAPDRYRSPDGVLLTHHSDTLLGDPFHGINCWLPLSTCHGTNSLQIATFPASVACLTRFARELDFDEDAYATGRALFFERLVASPELRDAVLPHVAPLETRYGELVMFDPRMVHGTAENIEDSTRVSLDFRLVPKDAHERHQRRLREAGRPTPEFGGMPLDRGGYYHEKTAFEL